MRRTLVFFLASVAFAACSSFSDSEDDAPVDAGGGDASVGAEASTDANGEASTSLDAGSDAPVDAMPPDMVVVPSAKAFLIDRYEVTVAQFIAYKDNVTQLGGGDAGFPPVCRFKLGLGPNSSGCAIASAPGLPMNCVDWCDAFVYCRDRGKRLCGAIAGGTVPAGKQVDTSYSQWVRACAGATTPNGFPYGPTPIDAKCNVNGNTLVEAGSYPECEGSVPGLFDMSGNVAEIDDSCTADAGKDDQCFWHGGSAGSSVNGAHCDNALPKLRQEYEAQTGFRCCRDL